MEKFSLFFRNLQQELKLFLFFTILFTLFRIVFISIYSYQIEDGSYMEVLAKNILYAENEARKIVLHTKNMPESSYTFYEKMEVLEKRLGEGFFRSHRGFLVNLREVYKYDATTIQMKNGDKVYLAKQKYNDFVTAYMKYLRSAG